MQWLRKFNLHAFAELAEAIRIRLKEQDDEATGSFYKPFH
jgi:hypothetical protein